MGHHRNQLSAHVGTTGSTPGCRGQRVSRRLRGIVHIRFGDPSGAHVGGRTPGGGFRATAMSHALASESLGGWYFNPTA